MLQLPSLSQWPDCVWHRWEVAFVLLQIYVWYTLCGEFSSFWLGGHWLSQMWLAQLLTYSLSWISLRPLLQRLPPGSWRPLLRARHWKLLPNLLVAMILGCFIAPVGRGQILPFGVSLAPELQSAKVLAEANSMPELLSLLLLVGLVAPTFEELLFRGFLMAALKPKPMLLSSLFFGAFHCHPGRTGGLRPFLPTALLGAWFARVAEKNCFTSCILLHQLWNGGHLILVAFLAHLRVKPWVLEAATCCYA